MANEFFDHLNNILQKKDDDFLDGKTKNSYSQYMILQYLSMEDDLLPIIHHIEKYQGMLSDDQMNKLLIRIIPKGKRFIDYKGKKEKVKDKDIVEKIASFFSVSEKKAREYLSILSEEDIQSFKAKFGGKQTEKLNSINS